MRTISIINQKGGCGKTTTSINLAACMARLGHRTLLVDMDPQGHCGVGLAVPEDQVERTIYDTLIEESDGKVCRMSEVIWQISSDFDLAPSTIKLAAFEQIFAGRSGREDRLSRALDSVRNTYEWCIIDCPPSVGLITFNALKASDEAIVPVETGFFSLHGLAKMMETLEVLRERCGKDILIRVLPTLYDTRTKLAREVLSELRAKFREYLMESTVNFNTKLKEAASFGQPITEYDPGSRGYKDFVNLARELMGHRPVDVEPAPSQGLSRPAELVQRAKQLAQLTNFQFGRGTVTLTQPQRENDTTIEIDIDSISAGGSSFMNGNGNAYAGNGDGAHASGGNGNGNGNGDGAHASVGSGNGASYGSGNGDGAGGSHEGGNGSGSGNGAGVSLGNGNGAHVSRLEFPPLLTGSGTSGASASNRVASAGTPSAPLPAQMKTTAQKIEEFYGVKQVGEEVVFAAKFESAKKVLLAGDFNGWQPVSTPLKNDRPGVWRMSLPLPPGRYRYRFVVDGKWVTDPHNQYVEANQYGELNNIIEVD